jgi:hypothetical protein
MTLKDKNDRINQLLAGADSLERIRFDEMVKTAALEVYQSGETLDAIKATLKTIAAKTGSRT